MKQKTIINIVFVYAAFNIILSMSMAVYFNNYRNKLERREYAVAKITSQNFLLDRDKWNCFEYTNGQCTAYNYKGE